MSPASNFDFHLIPVSPGEEADGMGACAQCAFIMGLMEKVGNRKSSKMPFCLAQGWQRTELSVALCKALIN